MALYVGARLVHTWITRRRPSTQGILRKSDEPGCCLTQQVDRFHAFLTSVGQSKFEGKLEYTISTYIIHKHHLQKNPAHVSTRRMVVVKQPFTARDLLDLL